MTRHQESCNEDLSFFLSPDVTTETVTTHSLELHIFVFGCSDQASAQIDVSGQVWLGRVRSDQNWLDQAGYQVKPISVIHFKKLQ